MKKIKSMKYFILVILSGVSLVAWAQSEPMKLTFKEAVDMALVKNVDYKTRQNEVERSSSQSHQSLANMGPSASINANLFQRQGRQTIQNPDTEQVEFKDVASNNFTMGLDVNLPLFGGFNRIQTYRASRSSLHSQEHALERSRQTTIFNVAQQYLQVLLSQELYGIAEGNYRNQLENLKRIEGQVEVGAMAGVNQYNQEAEVKRLETLIITAKNTYENDKLVLAQTLQLEPGVDFVLERPQFSAEETILIDISFDDLYATALSKRPDYKQQKEVVNNNTRTLSALRGSYFPTLSAFYSYNTSYNSTIPFSVQTQLTDLSPSHFYGLSLNIPIFNGLSTRNRVQSSRIDKENSLLQEVNLKTLIYRDVKRAHQNFEASKAGYVSATAQYEAAKKAFELEKERFELGASAFFEFSQANNALIQGQAAKAQAEFTLMFQQTILDYQVGVLTNPTN
jgi:outer membrane protein